MNHFCNIMVIHVLTQVDSNGRTAVHYAAFFGKAKALKFLVESAAKWLPRFDIYILYKLL